MAGIIPHEAELEAYEAILRAVLLKPTSWVRILYQILSFCVLYKNLTLKVVQKDSDEIEQ